MRSKRDIGQAKHERQLKAFTLWLNKRLEDLGSARRVNDVLQDLRDGEILFLISHLCLGTSKIPVYRSPSKDGDLSVVLSLDRLKAVVSALASKQGTSRAPPVGLKPQSLLEGNKEITLGLIWWLVYEWERQHGACEASLDQDLWIDSFLQSQEKNELSIRTCAQYKCCGVFRFVARMELGETKPSLQRQPLDMIVCIDVSGSMERQPSPKIDSVRRAVIEELFPRLSERDRFSLIVFSDFPRALLNLVEATEENLKVAAELLRSVDCEGGTDAIAALDMVLEHSLHPRASVPVCGLFFSDGMDLEHQVCQVQWPNNLALEGNDYADMQACNRRALALRQSRLQMLRTLCSTFSAEFDLMMVGCGADRDMEFLAIAADSCHGSFLECSEDALRETLGEFFLAKTSIIASSLRFEIQAENASIKVLASNHPVDIIHRGSVRVNLHNLSLRCFEDVHVEVTLDKGYDDCNVALRCCYTTDISEQTVVDSHLFLSNQLTASLVPQLDLEFERVILADGLKKSIGSYRNGISMLRSFISGFDPKNGLLSFLRGRIDHGLRLCENGPEQEAVKFLSRLHNELEIAKRVTLDDGRFLDLEFNVSDVQQLVEGRVKTEKVANLSRFSTLQRDLGPKTKSEPVNIGELPKIENRFEVRPKSVKSASPKHNASSAKTGSFKEQPELTRIKLNRFPKGLVPPKQPNTTKLSKQQNFKNEKHGGVQEEDKTIPEFLRIKLKSTGRRIIPVKPQTAIPSVVDNKKNVPTKKATFSKLPQVEAIPKEEKICEQPEFVRVKLRRIAEVPPKQRVSNDLKRESFNGRKQPLKQPAKPLNIVKGNANKGVKSPVTVKRINTSTGAKTTPTVKKNPWSAFLKNKAAGPAKKLISSPNSIPAKRSNVSVEPSKVAVNANRSLSPGDRSFRAAPTTQTMNRIGKLAPTTSQTPKIKSNHDHAEVSRVEENKKRFEGLRAMFSGQNKSIQREEASPQVQKASRFTSSVNGRWQPPKLETLKPPSLLQKKHRVPLVVEKASIFGECSVCFEADSRLVSYSSTCLTNHKPSICCSCFASNLDASGKPFLQCDDCGSQLSYAILKFCLDEAASEGSIVDREGILKTFDRLQFEKQAEGDAKCVTCVSCRAVQAVGGYLVSKCRVCEARTCAVHHCPAFGKHAIDLRSHVPDLSFPVKLRLGCQADLERCISWAVSWKVNLMDATERAKRWQEFIQTEKQFEQQGKYHPLVHLVFSHHKRSLRISSLPLLSCGFR